MESEAICRICYEETHTENPLLMPCACKGTIAFIHSHCLHTWIRVSLDHYCKLCNTAYTIDEVLFESLYEPRYYLMRILVYPHLLFLNLCSIYVLYACSTAPFPLGYILLGSLYNQIPYLLLIIVGVHGCILAPAFSIVQNKYRYVTYLCSWNRIPGMRINTCFYTLILLGGFIASFYYAIVGAVIVLLFLSKLYYIHSQVILEINTDLLLKIR
jgi:E3 ubiquitin-protein ligase DOA10